jgi:hypothetical protein
MYKDTEAKSRAIRGRLHALTACLPCEPRITLHVIESNRFCRVVITFGSGALNPLASSNHVLANQSLRGGL